MMGLLDRLKSRSSDAIGGHPVAEQMGEAYAAAQRRDYEAALAIWGPLAHAGVGRAQNNVGACFAEGLGVPRDLVLALRWLTLAAESGDAAGQRNLPRARPNSTAPRPNPATRRRRTC
jgi:TPR repeat protein